MALGSTIEWTESTWNPVTGCTRISAGCRLYTPNTTLTRASSDGCGSAPGGR